MSFFRFLTYALIGLSSIFVTNIYSEENTHGLYNDTPEFLTDRGDNCDGNIRERVKPLDDRTVAADVAISTLSAECEPLTIVANCVNVVSGHFFQIDKDLTSSTVEPLNIVRFYESGSEYESFCGYGFGSQFPFWASELQDGTRHHYGLISEREGF